MQLASGAIDLGDEAIDEALFRRPFEPRRKATGPA